MKIQTLLLPVVLLCGCSQETATHAADKTSHSTYEKKESAPPTAPAPKTTPTPTPAPKPLPDPDQGADKSAQKAPDLKPPEPKVPEQTAQDSDRLLVEQVRKALTNDPSTALIAPDIQVSAQSGTVTLRGDVQNEKDKSAIETVVKDVPGVRELKDEIEVKAG
jgi:hypothetical protein